MMDPTYSAIIVDDESPAIKMLQWSLSTYCPNVEVIATASSAQEAIEKIVALQPQVVFLDIEMPRMNGFEMLTHLPGKLPFKVIFTTAYDQYAIQAIKFSAVDYLMKPIDKDELINSISKLHEYNNIQPEQVKLLNTLKSDLKKIALSTLDGVEILEIDTIVHCRSDSNYTYVHFADKTKRLYTKTLKSLEEMLAGHSFMRIHQSHLINLKYLTKYIKGDGGDVVLSTGESMPVARNKKQDLVDYLGL
jgi:two-component system, LytTR family, response regulator